MDPKELLLRHFEKVVIGIFAAWLLWVAYVALLASPPELKMNVDLKTTIDKIDTHMKGYSFEMPKLEDPTADLKLQLDPVAVPSVEAFPSWLVHRRPSIAYTRAQGQQKVWPKHEPPTDFRVVDKGRGR